MFASYPAVGLKINFRISSVFSFLHLAAPVQGGHNFYLSIPFPAIHRRQNPVRFQRTGLEVLGADDGRCRSLGFDAGVMSESESPCLCDVLLFVFVWICSSSILSQLLYSILFLQFIASKFRHHNFPARVYILEKNKH